MTHISEHNYCFKRVQVTTRIYITYVGVCKGLLATALSKAGTGEVGREEVGSFRLRSSVRSSARCSFVCIPNRPRTERNSLTLGQATHRASKCFKPQKTSKKKAHYDVILTSDRLSDALQKLRLAHLIF